VATSVGGIPEVIRDEENGLLAEPRRPDILAGLASRMLTSPEETRQMGKTARETIESGFSLRRMIEQLEETYDQVLANSSRGR
jgi:glycosyltransferase involved in cell wall biosynthesis